MSTSFERDAEGGYSRGYVYTRSNNPTRESLEECLHKLEGGSGLTTAIAAYGNGNQSERRRRVILSYMATRLRLSRKQEVCHDS